MPDSLTELGIKRASDVQELYFIDKIGMKSIYYKTTIIPSQLKSPKRYYKLVRGLIRYEEGSNTVAYRRTYKSKGNQKNTQNSK